MVLAVDINLWAYFFYAFTLLFTHERITRIFFGERKTNLFLFVINLFAHAILTGAAYLFLNVTWITMIASLIGLLSLSFHYDASLTKRLVGTFGSWLTLLIFEMSVVVLFEYQPSFTLGAGEDGSTFIFLVLGVSLYLSVLIFSRFKNIKENSSMRMRSHLIHLMVLVITFAFIWMTFYLPRAFVPFFLVALFFMNFIFFYIQDRAALAEMEKKKGELTSQEKEYYFAQSELMVDTVVTVKGMRHDMKLHLATLKDYIVNDPAEAVDYVEYLMEGISKSEVYSDTGNVALDSIINYKLKDAKDKGIQVDLKIFAPVTIGIETPDIVVIIGNLLANAIDAVSKVEDKSINLQIVHQKGNLLIKVENSFDGVVKKGFETTKVGDGHGYGLKNVGKSVEKYQGKMDVEVTRDVFQVTVLLYGGKGQIRDTV